MINNIANSINSVSSFDVISTVGLLFIICVSAALLFLALVIAIIALKGYALWYAAKRNEKGWFVALLVINTAGILELIYLYFVVDYWKKNGKHKEVEKKETTE
jgi:uncharacterized membrane protein (DUF485 family)